MRHGPTVDEGQRRLRRCFRRPNQGPGAMAPGQRDSPTLSCFGRLLPRLLLSDGNALTAPSPSRHLQARLVELGEPTAGLILDEPYVTHCGAGLF